MGWERTMLLVALSTMLPLLAGEFDEIEKKIDVCTLDNGLRVILYRRGDAPVVSCITYVKTGSVDEVVGSTGIAHQLEHLAFKGTASIGTRDFASEQRLFAEIDKRYDDLLALQAELPSHARTALLEILAKLSSGGDHAAPDKIKEHTTVLRARWAKDGVKLDDARFAQLIELMNGWAARVQEADRFVIHNHYANVIGCAGGAGLNAFTSNDRTVYLVSLPANQIELWAALESDRYMNTVPRQLEKEKQVVLEERRMRTETRAFGKLYEAFDNMAFAAHPYGVAVIGHRSDILNYTREKILNFYRTHYTPRNTIVVLVGRFDVEKTRELLKQYFSKIPAVPAPAEPVTVEPKQTGERRVDVEFPAQPILLMGFHIPERKHPDTPALKVLADLASDGRSSRFYTALVKTRRAHTVSTWLGPGERYPRLWVASAEPSEESTLEKLEEDVCLEIERLRSVAPTADELKRVIASYRMGVLKTLQDNMGLAIELADYEALAGDWRGLFREIEAISAVQPEHVIAAAQKYLTRSNRTVARLISTEEPESPQVLGVPASPPKE